MSTPITPAQMSEAIGEVCQKLGQKSPYPTLTRGQWRLLELGQRQHGLIAVSDSWTQGDPQRRTVIRLIALRLLSPGIHDPELRITAHRLTDWAGVCLERHAKEVEIKRLQRDWQKV